MAKMEDFKNFVKERPNLISYVSNDQMTWQKFYEMYDLYGEDDNIWNDYKDKYQKEEKKNKEEKSNGKFNELLKMAKNMDVDKVQNSITSLQKALGLFGDLFNNKETNTNTNTNSYNPRPIYRKFDD